MLVSFFGERAMIRSSSIYVLCLAIIAATSGLLFGYDTAVVNGVLLFLRKEFALNNVQTETAASSLLVGCLIGAACAGFVGDRIGRKKSLMLSAFFFALSTVVAATASNLTYFEIGRVVGGLAIGLASVLTPVYTSELAPAGRRGMLVSLNQLAIVVGILLAYFVDWRLASFGDSSWRWMLAAAGVPSLLFLLGLFFIPESPRWLAGQQRSIEARKVLGRLYGENQAAVLLSEIQAAANEEQGTWGEIFSRQMRKPLIIALSLAFLCQVTGINAVLYYGSIVLVDHFGQLGPDVALAANVFIGVINLIATIAALFLIDRLGRRFMLLLGTCGMTLGLGILAVVSQLPQSSQWLLFGGILGYVACFAIGMGPIPWVLISEIFPNKIRGRAASLATAFLWIGTLLMTATFLNLKQTLGLSGVFGLYASLSLFSFLYILKEVPETKGKSLEQIQQIWELEDHGDHR